MSQRVCCPRHPNTALEMSTAEGRLVERCPRCERRRAAQCVDCGWQLDTMAHRCASCNRVHRNRRVLERKGARTCRAPGCIAAVPMGSKRQYCTVRCYNRKKHLRQMSKQRRDPKYRARKLATKKAWREANPVTVALHKRKGRLDGTWGFSSREAYLEAMRNQNLKRKEAHREWSRKHQTIRGRGEKPRCAKCGRVVAWKGRGAIPQHPLCRKGARRP